MTTHKDLCSFNVLCVVDAKGRRYARGYKNVWVPATETKPGYSKMGEQIYIGAIKANGLVKMSAKFLEKFPVFAGRSWYFEKNTLYSEDAFLALHPETPAVVSSRARDGEQAEEHAGAATPKSLDFGATYALSMMARSKKYEIKQSLDAAVGRDKSEALLGLAMYQLIDGGPACSYEDWCADHYVHRDAPLTSQQVSELYRSITQEHMDLYFKDRFARSLKENPSDTRFCALDSTSIPVTSADNPHAEYGHAKSDGHLPQVNLVVVLDRKTGDIVYACEYNGSINDVASFDYVCSRMERIGIDLSKICFTTDRGYDSNFNQCFLVDKKASFVMGRRITRRGNLREFILADRSRTPEKNLMSSATLLTSIERHVVQKADKIRSSSGEVCNVTTYIYRDPLLAAQLNMGKRKQVDEFVRKLNADPDDSSYKMLPEYREVKDYIAQRDVQLEGPHKAPVKRWFAHQQRLNEYERTAGCFAISTNLPLTAEEAFENYKLRNIIEVGFRAFKDGTRDRLRTSVCGYWGKLFCYLLAETFVMSLRKNAQEQPKMDGKPVCLPHNSVPAMLRKLEKLKITRCNPDDAWLVDQVTRTQRGYMVGIFKIKPPPKHL